MATTPTSNPIPSEDPRDLKFNAGKIDEEVNGSADYYTDRFSAQRLTNTGRNNQFQSQMQQQADDWVTQFNQQESDFQQFLLNSGYQFLGDYENGPYTISTRNQIVRYQNELWRLNAATNPSYITTGVNSTSWAVDVTHLVSVGDANLRQELATVSSIAGNNIVADPRGGTTAQALHFQTVKQHGAKGDGITVEDSYFTAAALAAPATNIAGVSKSALVPHPVSCIVYVNDGEYLLNTYLDVGNKDVTWVLSHGARIINPQYLNGRAYREGRQVNLYPHGTSGNTTGISARLQKIGEDLTDGPEVIGIIDPSKLASYPDLDMAAIYGEAKLPPALTTLSGTTFTATSVTFTTLMTANAKKILRVGMVIATTGTRYAGVISGWSSDFQTINVTGWYLYPGTTTPVTPTDGLTCVVNAFTKGWGLNVNAQLDANSYADYCVAAEFSVVNNKAYNVNAWIADFVNLGTYKLGTLINLRGGAAQSLYGAQIANVDTAININGVNTAYLTCVDANEVQMSLAKNTFTFGKGLTANTQTWNFRTSGEGNSTNDCIVTFSGSRSLGTATARFNVPNVQTKSILPDTENTSAIGTSTLRYASSYVVRRMWNATLGDFVGSGSPEGVLTASPGSTYRNSSGGAGTSFYVKESGTGNTGWVGK
jgi:hypothetical protein